MSDRPTILDELGRELVRAARQQQSREFAVLGGRTPRAVVIAVLAFLGLVAVAAAATLIIGRGDPIPINRGGDVLPELQPVAGSVRLNGLDVRDPDGGPAWDVRTSRSRTGAVCATVGQVHDGEFGLLGLDRRFRPLPPGAADTCSVRRSTGATLAGARGFRGGGRLSDLTVVSGVAAGSVRSAVTVAGGRTTRMRLGPDHAFLAVLRGLPEQVRPRVVLTDASGRRTTLRFADTGVFTAPDPSGESPWKLQYSTGKGGLRCVKGTRVPGPGVNAVWTPKRCGRAGAPFVAMRRFVPELPEWQRAMLPRDRGPRPTPTFHWELHPARTIVWGATPRSAGAVVLTGAGTPRRLPTDPGLAETTLPDGVTKAYSGRGGFIAVLDGRVDPARLRVTVGGRTVEPHTYDAAGRPIRREPTPAWRSVAAVDAVAARPPGHIVPASTSIGRRAADPAGGPGWALRVWQLRAHRAPSQPRSANTATCWSVGIERQRRLVEPVPGGGSRTVGREPGDVLCTDPRRPRQTPPPDVRIYVDDAAGADPKLVRVVVSGLLGDTARAAQLLGAGAPLPLRLGAYGSYLVLLEPRFAGRRLRVRVQRSDGSWRTVAQETRWQPDCAPQASVAVRVADPDGGPPWTTGRGRLNGLSCRFDGRLIAGRIATVVDGRNRVSFEPFSTGVLLARRPRPRKANRPLVIRVANASYRSDARRLSATPSSAQIARRTIPGRTVLTGSAASGVESITLRTPRDIRTLRPGPGGLFMAVYDGAFYDGRIEAIAHMRDGSTITQTFPLTQP